MRVATFNAASVRARLPLLVEWLQENPVDVLGIQETKVENDKFPRAEFEALGYELALNGQKSWNGVALLSKYPMTDVVAGFDDPDFREEARTITATINGVRMINTYVPNGNAVGNEKWQYKMLWLEKFREYLDRQDKSMPLLWMGDINVAPQPHDVFDSPKLLGNVGHHPDEFSRLTNIVSYGLIDLFRLFTFEGGHYTFWDFVVPAALQRGIGWRIDHIYATEALAERCTSCVIDVEARKREKPSDHTFVIAEFTD